MTPPKTRRSSVISRRLAIASAERSLQLCTAVEYRLGTGLALRSLTECKRRASGEVEDAHERSEANLQRLIRTSSSIQCGERRLGRVRLLQQRC